MHVMESGTVAHRSVVIERFSRDTAIRHDSASGLKNCGSTAIYRAMRTFGIAAVEINTEPLT